MLELQAVRSLSGKMKVLLVEDDPKQLLPLQIALSQAGHSVDGGKDGETAQWLLSEKDYDLLGSGLNVAMSQWSQSLSTLPCSGKNVSRSDDYGKRYKP